VTIKLDSECSLNTFLRNFNTFCGISIRNCGIFPGTGSYGSLTTTTFNCQSSRESPCFESFFFNVFIKHAGTEEEWYLEVFPWECRRSIRVCGCHNFSVGPNGRVSYLQAHFIKCVPLREMMQKDSDSRSLSLKKSTWSANGSILEWIRDTQNKWMNQCARIAWRKSQMGWHDFGETRNKEPKVEPNLFLFTFRSAKTTSNSMYDVAI